MRFLEELVYYYSAATCCVLPLDYKSFGLVLSEAMAAGKSVVGLNSEAL